MENEFQNPGIFDTAVFDISPMCMYRDSRLKPAKTTSAYPTTRPNGVGRSKWPQQIHLDSRVRILVVGLGRRYTHSRCRPAAAGPSWAFQREPRIAPNPIERLIDEFK